MNQVLHQFQNLERVIIDSSSLIYIQKAGFFELLNDALALCTVAGVIQETNFSHMNIHIFPLDSTDKTVDDQLFYAAVEHGIPIVSEDRDILIKAKYKKIPYFNALVMLHFLLFKGLFNDQQHQEYTKRLLSFAHYGPEVLWVGNEIYHEIVKYRSL